MLKWLTRRVKIIARIFFYWLVSHIVRQDRLILYTSSKNDLYRNISSLAGELTLRGVPFELLSYEELLIHTYPSLALLARAKVLVIDSSSPAAFVRLSDNTCLINCWHACGAYKKIAFDAKRKGFNDAAEEKRITRIHRCLSYFICSSEHTAEVYARAFRLRPEQMKVLGSPRTDSLLERSRALTVSETQPVTVLYAPTFRTKDGSRCMPDVPDVQGLAKALGNRDVRFAFRCHPSLTGSFEAPGWEDWSAVPQIRALEQTAVLITDYSSVFFDFLVFERPVLFYVPDIDAYQAEERELYFSPVEVFPETTCRDFRSLCTCLARFYGKRVSYRDFWATHMGACDGQSTRRVCDFIVSCFTRA